MIESQKIELDLALKRDFASASELESHIYKYIHFHSGKERAVSLRQMNRRFGIVAKKLGTTVGDTVRRLAAQDKLLVNTEHGRLWVMSLPLVKKALEAIKIELEEQELSFDEEKQAQVVAILWIDSGQASNL